MNEIQKDFFRATGRRLSGWSLQKQRINPNLNYMYWFRKSQRARRGSLWEKILRMILRHYQIKYGYQIYPETEIGPGLYLGHWGSVVINPGVKIGRNCNIAQGVTIGQANRGKKKGVPVLGDFVWIGANAVIVGNIKIGNNVLISPNALVTIDIPDNSIVTGNPATYTERLNATQDYINNAVEG